MAKGENGAEQYPVLAERHAQQCAGTSKFNRRTEHPVSCVSRDQIGDVYETIAREQCLSHRVPETTEALAQPPGECLRQTAHRRWAEKFAVIDLKGAVCRAAKPVSLFQYCVENGSEVAGRAVDDPQYLGGGGLLLRASRVSVKSRAFSIAMTACAAKFCKRAICLSENG